MRCIAICFIEERLNRNIRFVRREKHRDNNITYILIV